ncbi:hypothetical protein A4X06_0g7349 [Tilletia controversa]|uniref:Uncharacterized protein n=1 Tax=Tilletia controversa TaxID=13291 RepID=A0A8X7MMW7_9BASI|nr:hypothetical protein CF328_g6623 [Tilletia controversa]KAE8241926.1 hypothetical protein A4X06_0g7349 [Tilletia controversa]
MSGSGLSDFSVLQDTPPRRNASPAHRASARTAFDLSDEDESPPRRQKRKLVEMEEEDDDGTPSKINQLPADMKEWAKRVKLSKLHISDLVQFGQDYMTETNEDCCPFYLYRLYGQSLLQTQLARVGISTTNELREEVVPAMKRARSMLVRVEGDVKELKKSAESKLTDADAVRVLIHARTKDCRCSSYIVFKVAIQRMIASVFFSADVQTYSEKGDLPRVTSIYLERNPDLVGPAFAERYKTGEVHFLALVSSLIKKKVNNLRSHVRDKYHWSLGVDKNKSKQDLYELYIKLTKSYGVPVTKERVLRVAYIRSFAIKNNPRQVDGEPVEGWWEKLDETKFGAFQRHEKGISKAGSEDNDVRSAFAAAAAAANANSL